MYNHINGATIYYSSLLIRFLKFLQEPLQEMGGRKTENIELEVGRDESRTPKLKKRGNETNLMKDTRRQRNTEFYNQ